MEPNKKQINRYIKQVFITTCWGDSSLSTNSDFTPIPYEVVLCINTKGNSERQKNPAAREFTPSSFLIQVPGSSCSLHLGPCPPELPRTGSLLTQVSARGHLLREASLTAPTGGTISPFPFIVSTANVFLFTYHYLIFLPSSVSSKRASRGLNRFVLPLN